MNMLVMLLAFFVGILLFFCCANKTGTMLNCASLFIGMWSIVIIFANSGLYGYYVPSSRVNLITISGMIIFGVLYLVLGCNEYFHAEELLNMDITINYKFILILNIGIFIFMFPYFTSTISVILNNGFAYVRSLVGTSSDSKSTLINMVFSYLCYAPIQATLLVSLVVFFNGHRKALRLIIISGINMVIYELIFAARNGFIIILIYSIFMYVKCRFPYKKDRIVAFGKSHKLLFASIGCALVALLVMITKQRSFSGKSIFENAYVYFFSGPNYLDALLENFGTHFYLFGAATFGFVYNVIAMIANYFGAGILDSNNLINSTLTDKYFNISSNTHINAMSTVYYPFIMDWGYLGIVIGVVVMVAVSIWITKKCKSNNNSRWYAIYIYWMYFLYRTIFKSDAVSPTMFFILFFILIFTSNKKIVFGNIKLFYRE